MLIYRYECGAHIKQNVSVRYELKLTKANICIQSTYDLYGLRNSGT